MTGGFSASILARLHNRARERGEDYNLTLTRYAVERFLYRLSCSPVRDAFWLKGALLFNLWFDTPQRPTRDADFLNTGPGDAELLESTMREICVISAKDGMVFDPDSVRVEEIREEADYGGLRVRLTGKLGNARCPIQIDVGYGDVVIPGPELTEYPVLLDELPAPELMVYPRSAMVAEKLEAIVNLGMANSRMKDYFDLHVLASQEEWERDRLADAIAATFARRKTPLPEGVPLGLSDEFVREKRPLWKAFINKNRLVAPELETVINDIRGFTLDPLRKAREKNGSGE